MKVKSFDGFRFFLITLVFVSLCNLFTVLESTKTLFQNHLTYGCVEIFFTLSGFCIYLGYNSKFKNISGKDLLFFLYVLFILSLFVSFIYSELLKKLKSKPKEKLIQETKQMPAAELSAHNKI